MTYVLTASKLMKAGEIKAYCADMRKNADFMFQQERMIREALLKKIQGGSPCEQTFAR